MSQTFTYRPMNLYQNFLEASQTHPECVIAFDAPLGAFPELGIETTYAASHQALLERAYQLAAKGIGKGDKVMIFKDQKFDTYLLAVALTFLGAVPVMVSYHFPSEVIAVFTERLEKPFIIYDEVTQARVDAVTGLEINRKIYIPDLIAVEGKTVPMALLADDEIAYITHTSGTTGIPKLICHSANTMGWRTKWQKTVLAYIPERRIVGFHISPVHSRFNIGMSSLMNMGFPLLALSTADTAVVARLFAQYQPQAVETHPNHFMQWMSLAEHQPEIFAQTAYFHSTFDAINNQVMAAFLKASQADEPVFLQVYGQSECGPMILKAHRLESLKSSNARDMGVGLGDLTKARITDASGQVLPALTDGHVQLYSKGRALTYFKEDERFNQNVYGDWWDSGDYGCLDEAGHLILKDRQVDVIENIDSNLAIEDYLLDRLDFLAEAIIIPDQTGRPQPILALKAVAKFDEQAWWATISDLQRMNFPIILDYDAIPRTGTMKVQRLQLVEWLKSGKISSSN